MIAKQLFKQLTSGKKINQAIAKSATLRISQCSRFGFVSLKNIQQISKASFLGSNKAFQIVHRNSFSTSAEANLEEQIDTLNAQFDKQYEEKKYDDCQETLRQLVELKQANDLDIGYEVQQTGHVLIKNKRVKDGLDVLYDLKGQLEQLNIDDALLQSKIAENVSKGEMLVANLQKATDILDETISKVEKIVSYENPQLYDMLARLYSQRGNIYALEKQKKNDYIGEYQKAKDIYEKFEELIPEQKRSYAVILQKMANALIQKQEIDLAETNIAKSKQLWMELEKHEPVDPNHFSTLVTFSVVELFKGRPAQGMKIINQCKLDLEQKIKTDKSYTQSYMATITIIAGIFRQNPAAKQALQQVRDDFDKGLKLLEGSDDDGPTKLLFEEYKSIRGQLFE